MTLQDSSHYLVLSIQAFPAIIGYFHLLYLFWFCMRHLNTILYFQIYLALSLFRCLWHTARIQYILKIHRCKNTIYLENPSIHICITKPYWTRLWWSSTCHRLFGRATLYFLRQIKVTHLILDFAWSILTRNKQHVLDIIPVKSHTSKV